jgi:hypothetical protein
MIRNLEEGRSGNCRQALHGSSFLPFSLLLHRVGNGISFEKIPRNSLGMVSVIPRKKALIPRHSEFRGRANSEARNGTEWYSAEKMSFTKQQQNNLTKGFVCTSKAVEGKRDESSLYFKALIFV